MKGDRATTVGIIPDDIWKHGKWFVGKLQMPLTSSEKNPPALIYDETRKWSLYIPINWIKDIHMGKELKKYFWMWFDKNHGINIEEGTPVEDIQYW